MTDNTPLISVIVPIYNIEEFLEPCIESILAQTYKNFELYLVDDGSTDTSGKIADRYVGTDDRITVFHKPNGGLSDARNYGIDRAHGEYLTFIDSDDLIGPDYLRILVELAEQNGAEISVIKCKEVPEKILLQDIELSSADNRNVVNEEEAIKKMCIRDGFGISAWAKLYKASLYETRRFPQGRLYEDLFTVPYAFAEASKIAYSDSIQYFWRLRQNSIMHRPLREIDFDVFNGLSALVDFVDEKYPNLHDAAVCRFVYDFYMTILERLVNQKQYKQKANELKREYAKYLDEVKTNSYISKNTKFKTKLFLMNVMFYKIFYKLYSIVK